MANVLRAAALAVAASTVALSTPVVAEDYFKDKTVTVVVPSGSGGSFHIYCQIVTESLVMEALEQAAVDQGLDRATARLLTLETAFGAAHWVSRLV